MQNITEHHKSHHINWLRASVLGANDGIVSTASLILGVATAASSHHQILITGVAGLAAGALSMAAGEYVSVSSQEDTEKADLKMEEKELQIHREYETEELAQIYVGRGLDEELARTVAKKLMAHDALGSHARDELGITETLTAKPIQAALSSAASFAIGAVLPLIMVIVSGEKNLILWVSLSTLIFLIILGMVAAKIGGANLLKGAVRVAFWGVLAMAFTAGIGTLFGTVV